MPREFDFLIIGGGLFGSYAAVYLAERGHKVCLVEKEGRLFRKASVVNQARIHGGYHYPRSISTARISDHHKERFISDHRQFVNTSFEHYYALDAYNSLTDATAFERICQTLDIPCKEIAHHPAFRLDRIQALYLTEEYSFDPYLIAAYYRQRLRDADVVIKTNTAVTAADTIGNKWRIQTIGQTPDDEDALTAAGVINATYSNTNTTNRIFDQPLFDLTHEISEVCLVKSDVLNDIGLTVMDGPFCSIMPFGLSGLSSLSSVIYTHHEVSQTAEPKFDCQSDHASCRPDYLSACNVCELRPKTAFRKMRAQLRHYISDTVDLTHISSLYTVKSKLRASFIDDGRPTIVQRLSNTPPFLCVFSGKINSIYEIEAALDDV